jgi:hypothetical protein
MVAEFVNIINSNQNGFKIEILDINESKVFGHNSCVHVYVYTGGK